jgi:CHASE2 domain-containing sensor protein
MYHELHQQGIRARALDCLSMMNLADFLIGFFVVFGCLFLVGITRGKWVSQKVWVFLWLTVSLLFAVFLCVSFVLETVFVSFALGGSLGFVIAVTAHTSEHAIKETRK